MGSTFLETIYSGDNYKQIKMGDFLLIKKRTGDNTELKNKTVQCYLKAYKIFFHCHFLPTPIN